MAVSQNNLTRKLTIRMETSTDKFENRTINKVNPSSAATDTKLYKFFSDESISDVTGLPYGIAYYLNGTFNKLTKTDTAELVNE